MARPRSGVISADIDDLLRPLSARSVVASALLGTHPPRLRGRLLVALAEEFGIAPGTARVALTRMVDRGELVNDGGVYELAGDLARRQARQDLGRVSAAASPWDGRWEQAIVVGSGRTANDRHRLRQVLAAARLGEVREGVWMRPDNLDRVAAESVPSVTEHVLWLVAEVDDGIARSLVRRIFDTDGWQSLAVALIDAMRSPQGRLTERFRLAAAVLQHLTHDPLLPEPLCPPGWPADELRREYAAYELDLQHALRHFFASAG